MGWSQSLRCKGTHYPNPTPDTQSPIHPPSAILHPLPTKQYWFRAKRYGWGWGMPATWQGWALLLGYFVLIASVPPILVLDSLPLFFAFISLMVTAVI